MNIAEIAVSVKVTADFAERVELTITRMLLVARSVAATLPSPIAARKGAPSIRIGQRRHPTHQADPPGRDRATRPHDHVEASGRRPCHLPDRKSARRPSPAKHPAGPPTPQKPPFAPPHAGGFERRGHAQDPAASVRRRPQTKNEHKMGEQNSQVTKAFFSYDFLLKILAISAG